MTSIATPTNSTNVREHTTRTVSVTVALWGGLVALGGVEDVFAKLEAEAIASLAAFALAYALSMYFLDAPLRAHVRGLARTPLAIVAWLVVAALAWFSIDGTHAVSPLATWAGALAALFAAPLAAVLTAAAIERAAVLRLSAAKRPAARPAAI